MMASEGRVETRSSSAEDVEEGGNDLLSALRSITEVLHQTLRTRQQPPPPAIDRDTKAMTALHEFKHQKPPEFKGDPNPVVAEQCLDDINKILDARRIREADSRITLAAYMFSGEALQWWKMILRTHRVETMTWDQFTEIFLDKYFPAVMQEAKVEEFATLCQRMKTVPEYDAIFIKLSRYAPELVSTEFKKARKFERRLRPSIRSKVSVLRLQTYAEVLESALVAERDCEEFRKIREKRQARKQNSQQSSKKQKTFSSSSQGLSAQEPQQQTRWRPVVCYQCGQPGHLRRDCREGVSQSVTGPLKPTGSSSFRPQTQAPQPSNSNRSFHRTQASSQGSVRPYQQRTQNTGPGQRLQEQNSQGRINAFAYEQEESSNPTLVQGKQFIRGVPELS